jgi:pyridoxine kinase
MPALLSFQSFVSVGHVGHAAALPPLYALGVEVWPLHTVLFSSHPGWQGWQGERVGQGLLSRLLDGIEATGALARADGLLTGYLGQPDTAAVALDALTRIRAQRPDARFICDPVLGDDGQLYVSPALIERYRDALLPAADLATPNAFELATLADRDVSSLEAACAACAMLGCPAIVATGLTLTELPDDQLGVLVWTRDARWLIRAPRIPGVYYGTGDVFTAVLTAHLLRQRALPDAALAATSALTQLIARTHALSGRELALTGHPWALDARHPHVTLERLP